MVEHIVVLLIAALACVYFYAFLRRARNTAGQLARAVEELASKNYSNLQSEGDTSLFRLREEMMAQDEEIVRLKERVEQAECALRESNQRYDLAVHSASDGRWEWNLKTGEVIYSPRWKSMLGYADDEIADHIGEWRTRIHPEDHDDAVLQLEAHVNGDSPHFECDHRLRQRDGSYRWILARGSAIRHASGKAYRFVGLNTDISEIKRAQQVLMEMAAGVSTARGDAFFQTLVRSFARTLNVHRAFVTECVNYPTTRVRIKAYWAGDDFIPNKEFELAGTPCEEVIHQGKNCFYQTGLAKLFPREAHLGEDSYFGMPIFSSSGTVMGHIALYDQQPMNEDFVIEPVFKIFATRAGAEMERLSAEIALAMEKSLNHGLLDAMDEGVISTDAAGRVAYMNPAAERMTGRRRTDAIGTPIAQVFRTEDRATSALPRCLGQRVAARDSGAAVLLAHDGGKLSVQQWAASFVDQNGAVAGGVLLFNHDGARLEVPLLSSLHAA